VDGVAVHVVGDADVDVVWGGDVVNGGVGVGIVVTVGVAVGVVVVEVVEPGEVVVGVVGVVVGAVVVGVGVVVVGVVVGEVVVGVGVGVVVVGSSWTVTVPPPLTPTSWRSPSIRSWPRTPTLTRYVPGGRPPIDAV
jgi:hypothetical protein